MAFANWHEKSQYIVALQTPCSASLEALHSQALAQGFEVTAFHEPDLNDELTALAFSPSPANRKLLSSLPLAGRENGSKTKHVVSA